MSQYLSEKYPNYKTKRKRTTEDLANKFEFKIRI